ncbi:TrbI/VirB10 family protein [Brevundimonas diminuta]|uniref:TrbI/VirB10 family protein n=1 Tax=Brevundimonas diminuta TaxID=293 RepID=UPI0019C52930|nr:TrbI/VirB10 family protein [Brevundimonas diminuta]MBD3818147.1 TrbI/VirB10 family protein [Brevundimonas diminuta]
MSDRTEAAAGPEAPERDSEAPRPASREALRLRGDPPPVTRLSKKVVLGLGGIGALAIGAALTFALREPGQAPAAELYNTETRAVADRVASGPRDYSQLPPGTPALGPPLPGDLGRPIVGAQNRGVDVDAPAMGTPGTPPAPTAAEQAAARAAQAREAALASALFLSNRAGAQASSPDPALELAPALAGSGPDGPASQSSSRQAFLDRPAETRTTNAGRLTAPASPNTVQAGSVIAAALITGLRSDLPGQVTAQVTEHVYDSVTGRILLIPQGARLIGDYDASTAFGERRILLTWNRLILPDGRSMVLDRMPAGDAAGHAGLEDRVDEHWGGVLKAAGLSTLLSVGTELAIDDGDMLAEAIRNGGQDVFNQAGQEIVRRQLAIRPTLTVRPGFPVRVIVSRDLILEPWEGR